MSSLQLGLNGRCGSDSGAGVNLSARDASDVLRLLNLLLGDRGGELAVLAPRDGHADSSIMASKHSLKVMAKTILQQRRARARYFKSSMFSEPAWDMMLALFANEDSDRRMTITGLAECSGAPLTTALRWIDFLEQEHFIVRRPSPVDRRIMFIEMASLGTDQMTAYLEYC